MLNEEIKHQYKRWYGTFLGFRQSHAYWMYKVIDDVLNDNEQIEGIIEIGTGRGALSIFLGLECYERGLKPLITYDILPLIRKPKLFKLLGIKFINRDCYHGDSIREMNEYIDNKPILFFSDNGNKLRDFNYFIKLLPKDSVFASHDWESIAKAKLTEKNTKENVEKYSLQSLFRKEWDGPPDYIKTCFWRKTI